MKILNQDLLTLFISLTMAFMGYPQDATSQATPDRDPHQGQLKASGFKFLASADPQYDSRELEVKDGCISAKPGTEAARVDRLFDRMFRDMAEDAAIKGLIIAGNITRHSRGIELCHYKQLLQKHDQSTEVFEGSGENDHFTPHPGDGVHPTDRNAWWCHNSKGIHEYIGAKERSTAVNRSTLRPRLVTSWAGHLPVSWEDDYPTHHYSWDWDGVHFVQLNLYPGSGLTGNAQMENGHFIDPMQSLDFLKQDLAEQVGPTGRPVVLIHHFGFDAESLTEWPESERAAYWDAIAGYNVVAILTGGNHRDIRKNEHTGKEMDTTPFYIPWTRPEGAVRSNQYAKNILHTFLVGSMKNGGFYSEFTFEDGKLTARKYKGLDQVLSSEQVFSIPGGLGQ